MLYQSDSSSRERCWNAKYSSMHENALVSSFIVFLLVSRRSSVLTRGTAYVQTVVLYSYLVPYFDSTIRVLVHCSRL